MPLDEVNANVMVAALLSCPTHACVTVIIFTVCITVILNQQPPALLLACAPSTFTNNTTTSCTQTRAYLIRASLRQLHRFEGAGL